MTVLERFVAELGFEQTDVRALEKFEQRTAALSKKLDDFATPLIAAGSALTGLSVGSAMATDQFEEGINKIVALTVGTREELNGMKDDILAMSLETQRPVDQLTDALFAIYSDGRRGAEALDILRKSAMASRSGLGTVEQTTRFALGSLNLYRDSLDDASHALDIFTAIGREGNFETEKLAAVIPKVSTIASNMGVKLEGVGAAIAVLSKGGANINEVATMVQGMFKAILRPSEGAIKMLEGMNISVTNLQDAMREHGLVGAIGLLKESISELDDPTMTATQVIAELFSDVEGMMGALPIITKEYDQLVTATENIANSQGDLERAFGESKTVFTTFMLALDAIKIAIGERSLDMFRPIAEAVERFTIWFQKSDSALKDWVSRIVTFGPILLGTGIALKAVAFSLGPLVRLFHTGIVPLTKFMGSLVTRPVFTFGKVIAKLMPILGKLRIALALAFGPWGLVIAAATFVFFQFRKEIMAFLGGFVRGFRAGFGKIRETFQPAIDAFKETWQAIRSLFTPLDATAEYLDQARAAGQKFGTVVAHVLRYVVRGIAFLLGGMARVVTAVVRFGRVIWDFLVGIKNAIFDLFAGKSLREVGHDLMWTFLMGLQEIGGIIWDYIKGLWDSILRLFGKEVDSPEMTEIEVDQKVKVKTEVDEEDVETPETPDESWIEKILGGKTGDPVEVPVTPVLEDGFDVDDLWTGGGSLLRWRPEDQAVIDAAAETLRNAVTEPFEMVEFAVDPVTQEELQLRGPEEGFEVEAPEYEDPSFWDRLLGRLRMGVEVSVDENAAQVQVLNRQTELLREMVDSSKQVVEAVREQMVPDEDQERSLFPGIEAGIEINADESTSFFRWNQEDEAAVNAAAETLRNAVTKPIELAREVVTPDLQAGVEVNVDNVAATVAEQALSIPEIQVPLALIESTAQAAAAVNAPVAQPGDTGQGVAAERTINFQPGSVTLEIQVNAEEGVDADSITRMASEPMIRQFRQVIREVDSNNRV